MAKTLSTMLDLGTKAPDFILLEVVSGKMVSVGDFASAVATRSLQARKLALQSRASLRRNL